MPSYSPWGHKELDTTDEALDKRLYIRLKKQIKQAVLRSLKLYTCILVHWGLKKRTSRKLLHEVIQKLRLLP